MNAAVNRAAFLFLDIRDGGDVDVSSVCEVAGRFAETGGNGVVAGEQFVGIAGALGEMVSYDEVAAFDVGGCLGVIALGVAGALVFAHDSRIGIGQVALCVAGLGDLFDGAGGLGFWTPGFPFALGVGFGLWIVLFLFFLLLFGGALFKLGDGLIHLGFEGFATGDFFREALVIRFGVVGFFGLGHEFGDVDLKLLPESLGPLVGDVLVDGGVGFEVGAVGGNFAKLEQAEAAGELEDVDEGGADGGEVFAAELADGVVVGVGVGGEVAHGDVAVGGALDFSRTEDAVTVAVNEKGEHHVGRHLSAAASTLIDVEVVERKALGGFNDEVNKVVFAHPIPKIGRKKHGCVTSDIDELGCHASVKQRALQWSADFSPTDS